MDATGCWRLAADSFPPAFIHLLIILLVFPGNDGLPPIFVVQVPLDSLLDAVGKFRFRQPAQFFMDFHRVNGVAAVMAFTVRNMMDEAFRFAQFFANQFDDVDIPHFIMAADVIDFADTALLEDESMARQWSST